MTVPLDKTKTFIIRSPHSLHSSPCAHFLKLSSAQICAQTFPLPPDLCPGLADEEVSVGKGPVRSGLSPGISGSRLFGEQAVPPPCIEPHVFPVVFQSRSAAPAYRTRAGAFSWRFVWPGLWDWLKYRYVRQNAPTVLIISHNQYIRVWWGLTSFSFNYFSSRSDIKTALQMMGEFTGVFTVYWRLYLIHIR